MPARAGGSSGGLAAGLATLVLMATGCAAPFAEMQGARLVGRGRVEVTGGYTSVFQSGEQSGTIQREYSLFLTASAGEKMDWRVRYTRMAFPGAEPDEGINVLGMGPKFALKPDRVAVALPIGLAFGGSVDTGETVQIHPTFFFTNPLASGIDLDFSTKVLLPLQGGSIGVAANLGLGISTNLECWALRPEVGVLAYSVTEGGYLLQASIGLAWKPGR